MKTIAEQVWPVENYTDKINFAVKYTLLNFPWLTFTVPQIVERIKNGYPWLALENDRQKTTLEKLIAKASGRLVQLGLIVRVKNSTTVERTWQATKIAMESGNTVITSIDSVAHTDKAKAACQRRSIGGRTLFKLNNLKIVA
jgi:hypothetical protein